MARCRREVRAVSARHVTVFWRYRRQRLDGDRAGPCSPLIDVPPRRAYKLVERGRIRGFYLRYRLPDDVWGIIEAERAHRRAIEDRIAGDVAEIEASREREKAYRRQWVAGLEPPKQFTDDEGIRWRFSR